MKEIKEPKVLVSNKSVSKSGCAFSKVVEFVDLGKKFKITHSSGNYYSHSNIYVMLPDFTWKDVANGFDLDAPFVEYIWDEDEKLKSMSEIYDKAIAYINSVYY